MERDALASIDRISRFLEARRADLTIDADVHATDTSRYPPLPVPHTYHGRPISAEDIVTEMDSAFVSAANIWENPAATKYSGDEDQNAEVLLAANQYVFEAARVWPGRFFPSGWTDPRACGVANAVRITELCVRRFGFGLVKMNPAQNEFPMDSAAVTTVADRIVELGAVPVFHFGADSPYTPAAALEAVARRYDEHPVVAVHMGGGGAGYVDAERLYHEARELGLRHSNIRYIFSAMRDTYIEEALITYQMAGPPFCHNLFCGSDAPYGRMSWNFGGFRQMFTSLENATRHPDRRVRDHPRLFQDGVRDNYLGGNFARFLLDTYQRLLRAEQVATV